MGDRETIVLETERLVLRRFREDDAEFVLDLVNQPSFLRYIGDKGVRTIDDARRYIVDTHIDSYTKHGFGAYLVILKATGEPIGTCGLLKREVLEDADVGFAFLPAYWSRGYAFESASAVMRYARDVLGRDRILAATVVDNEASIKLLGKLGLRFERMVRLAEDEEEVKLFATSSTGRATA